ncbi:hypothetical protein ACFSQD_12130 [Flavihumibacter stibioxidans]|uniref:Uncharacterized protein n=1 Tax=Flavihumibacter stibioxidans TaxID=1834163 RepID=A0ABR7M9W3_9BACT|nr:hypothetical protein [Flavihumibacter stibioxidans]MBC6491624.1 hypothetical protein [Flavihumibacter stibioxidans]
MRIAFTILILLFNFAVMARPSSLRIDTILPQKSIGSDLAGFAVDNLGYVYLHHQNGQLKKLSPRGDSVAVFNDIRRFGKLYSIDVSNPLKVLLFYKDFGTIVVLDRFLNQRNTIDLRQHNILQAKTIAQSFDNGVWVYDELDGKLKRLDDHGTVISETVDFRILFEAAPSPVAITDADRSVYLYDPEKGLYVLDYFGTLRNKVALLGWTDVQVIGNRFIGRKGEQLESYTTGTLDLKEQELGELLKGAKKIQLSMDHLYVLRDGVLHIYTLSNQ